MAPSSETDVLFERLARFGSVVLVTQLEYTRVAGPPSRPQNAPQKSGQTAFMFPGRKSAFRAFLVAELLLAKIRPGKPIYGPQAVLRNIEYPVVKGAVSAATYRRAVPGPSLAETWAPSDPTGPSQTPNSSLNSVLAGAGAPFGP